MVENTSETGSSPTQRADDHPVVISPTIDFLIVGLLISMLAFGAAAILF